MERWTTAIIRLTKVVQAIPVEVALRMIIVSLSLCRFWWLRREKKEKRPRDLVLLQLLIRGRGGAKISRNRPPSQPKVPLRCAQLLSEGRRLTHSLNWNLSNLPRPQPLHIIIHIIHNSKNSKLLICSIQWRQSYPVMSPTPVAFLTAHVLVFKRNTCSVSTFVNLTLPY